MNLKEKKTGFINADHTLSVYLKEINKYKVLTADEEVDLVERMRNGDNNARSTLIAANQRFVYAVAKRYANDDNVLDLVNEGNIGLMQALETFDPSKGNRFLSYAIWYIRREINAYLNNDNLLIRKTNNTKTVYKLSKIKEKFYAENNRYPDTDEIAAILETEYGLKIKDKTDLLDISTTSISTCFDDEDARAFENTPYFTEKTAVDNDYLPEMDNEFNSSVSGALMSILSEREQTIVKMAFGIGFNKEYTNAEIGEELGMSSERVRQLKNGAIEKMKKIAVSKHLSF
jgi:RNA polymerase primary sigma factor